MAGKTGRNTNPDREHHIACDHFPSIDRPQILVTEKLIPIVEDPKNYLNGDGAPTYILRTLNANEAAQFINDCKKPNPNKFKK